MVRPDHLIGISSGYTYAENRMHAGNHVLLNSGYQATFRGAAMGTYLRLSEPAACQKFDQESIHSLRLLFHNGMPGSVHQVNTLELRTAHVHAFK